MANEPRPQPPSRNDNREIVEAIKAGDGRVVKAIADLTQRLTGQRPREKAEQDKAVAAREVETTKESGQAAKQQTTGDKVRGAAIGGAGAGLSAALQAIADPMQTAMEKVATSVRATLTETAAQGAIIATQAMTANTASEATLMRAGQVGAGAGQAAGDFLFSDMEAVMRGARGGDFDQLRQMASMGIGVGDDLLERVAGRQYQQSKRAREFDKRVTGKIEGAFESDMGDQFKAALDAAAKNVREWGAKLDQDKQKLDDVLNRQAASPSE